MGFNEKLPALVLQKFMKNINADIKKRKQQEETRKQHLQSQRNNQKNISKRKRR